MSQPKSANPNITRKISRSGQSENAYLEDRVKKKLENTQFPLTKTGWIKVVSTLFTVVGMILFLFQSWNVCIDIPNWYLVVFPSCAGISVFVQTFFYLIFACEVAKKRPGLWIKADIWSNFLAALVCISGSAVTAMEDLDCTQNEDMHISVPGPLCIVGGVFQIMGCGAIFLLYRYVEVQEETTEAMPRRTLHVLDARKSVQA